MFYEDYNLVLKVRWMTDCSLEYAAGVLMNELLPTSEYYSTDQAWSRYCYEYFHVICFQFPNLGSSVMYLYSLNDVNESAIRDWH
jgi:hypothetical protein